MQSMVDSQEALMHTYLNLSPQPGNTGMSESTSNVYQTSSEEMEATRLAEQRHLLLTQPQPTVTPSASELNIVNWMQGVDYRLMQIESCITSLVQQTSMVANTPVVGNPPPSSTTAQIRRRDLETVLGPLFCRHPIPSTIELSSVTRTLEHMYPHLERRPILSQVRKWFRKRREELGQKVFAQAQSRWGNQSMDKGQIERLLADLRRDRQVLTQILQGCGMDLEVNEACLNMIHSKVESYLTRRKSLTGKSHLDSDDD